MHLLKFPRVHTGISVRYGDIVRLQKSEIQLRQLDGVARGNAAPVAARKHAVSVLQCCHGHAAALVIEAAMRKIHTCLKRERVICTGIKIRAKASDKRSLCAEA